jgi:hypothetical protein
VTGADGLILFHLAEVPPLVKNKMTLVASLHCREVVVYFFYREEDGVFFRLEKSQSENMLPVSVTERPTIMF